MVLIVFAEGVVADDPYMDNNPPKLGINLAPTQGLTDNTFTISEFLYLLRNNPWITFSTDTAHRRDDTNATFPNYRRGEARRATLSSARRVFRPTARGLTL